MNCPGCASEMTHPALDGRLGTTLEIDLCPACRVIWFDQFESLRLTPAATLKVFGKISEPSSGSAAPLPGVLRCPRCGTRLILTHDMQRSTPFQYWRCDGGHGRLITFIDFLREKDFVRPLTPQQLDQLRQNVQTINCSNCGAAINLARDSVCTHCGSAVSMLDLTHMARTIDHLHHHASGQEPADRIPGAPPPREPTDIQALVRALSTAPADSPPSLIETGLGLLGDLLKRTLIP